MEQPQRANSSSQTSSSETRAPATDSLQAALSTDYSFGRRLIVSACTAEPFNPIHRIRLLIFEMAFGHWESSLSIADELTDVIPDNPLPLYLRGLVMLRQGEQKRAVNVIRKLTESEIDFTPARFLEAEAQVTTRAKGAARILEQLPSEPEYAPAWADLLSKLVINGIKDADRHVKTWLSKVEKQEQTGSSVALLQHICRLKAADFDELQEILASQRIDSRSEQLVLLFCHDRLTDMDSLTEAVAACRKLSQRFPDRPAVRRLYTALMTRMASREAGAERYDPAMRLVEQCLSLEPAETIHYQNLAALFTFRKELEAYHNAWFDLNRHHYRLALLGRINRAESLAIARMHRLFAQQSRMTADRPELGQRNEGVFRKDGEPQSGEAAGRLIVDSDRIRRDPDQLRSWIFHSQAELTLRHWALGRDPFDFLLQPADTATATARLDGLSAQARSLQILVPDEGELLADSFIRIWQEALKSFCASYVAPPDHRDISELRRQYVELTADILLVCYTWQPDGHRADLVDEFIGMMHAVFPFFDESALQAVMSDNENPPGFSIGLLHHFLTDLLGLAEGEHRPLQASERVRVVGAMEACICERMAHAVYNDLRETADAVDRALVYIDRARSCRTENAELELSAARFLAHGGYYDEARAALSLFHRFVSPDDHQLISEAENIQEFLEARKTDGDTGRKRAGFVRSEAAGEIDSLDVEQLIGELEVNSGAIHLYEQLTRMLVRHGRFPDALIWSERALAKCLSRKGQIRARHLNLEILGLRELQDCDQSAVELYIKGAHQPALDAIPSNGQDAAQNYTLWYITGRCLLATGKPEEARSAFQEALRRCDRRLHRPILSRLASDVDEAYLEFARRTIGDELTAGRFDAALRHTMSVLQDLQHPQIALLDLAQVFLRKGLHDLNHDNNRLEVPVISLDVPWQGQLTAALAQPAELERAKQLAELSLQVHEASQREAKSVLNKVSVYRTQAMIAEGLSRSAELLKSKDIEGALAALDDLGPDAASAHVQQQRALLLLKLGRLAEARSVFDNMKLGESETFRDFRERFPGLLFRAGLDVACRHIQEGEADAALEELEVLIPASDDDRLEFAYARAFAFSLTGYAEKRQGNLPAAHEKLSRALGEVEPVVHLARGADHTRLLQLYEKLDTDLSVLERQLP